MTRKTTSIILDADVLKRAQELGLNISATCEHAIRLYIDAIENADLTLTSKGTPSSLRLTKAVDIDPSKLKIDADTINFDDFESSLLRRQSRGTAHENRNYATKYVHCLEEWNLSDLQTLSAGKRQHVLKALTNLSKFLGCHKAFLQLVKDFDLKWTGKSASDLIIDRMTRSFNPDDVFQWIRKAKDARPELTDFMDLMAFTGMRLKDAIAAYNLIISLSKTGKLATYYKKDTLEHFRFKEIFIRHTKKAFISFVPSDLVAKIAARDPVPTLKGSLIKRLKRSMLKSRFGDVRECHASFMLKFLKQSEIDFLHGRVSANVFMTNYFNPSLIDDLKERTFKGIEAIREKLAQRVLK